MNHGSGPEARKISGKRRKTCGEIRRPRRGEAVKHGGFGKARRRSDQDAEATQRSGGLSASGGLGRFRRRGGVGVKGQLEQDTRSLDSCGFFHAHPFLTGPSAMDEEPAERSQSPRFGRIYGQVQFRQGKGAPHAEALGGSLVRSGSGALPFASPEPIKPRGHHGATGSGAFALTWLCPASGLRLRDRWRSAGGGSTRGWQRPTRRPIVRISVRWREPG